MGNRSGPFRDLRDPSGIGLRVGSGCKLPRTFVNGSPPRRCTAPGTTAARLTSSLLDDHKQRARLTAIGRAHATTDDTYTALAAAL